LKVKINKSVILSVNEELERAVFRSRKSVQEILRTIAVSHPEVTFNQEEWDEISPEIQEKIIMRVKRTLLEIP
jgi:hypothetical protein